ncbi:hypothetical protein BH10BAC5_BH10BAC5_15860 [soil metagenome]
MKNPINVLKGILVLGAFVMMAFTGCNNSNVTAPAADNLEMSVYSYPGVTDAPSSIILDSIKVLLKDIKLNVSGQSDTNNFKTGPFMIRLNPNSSINIISSALIPNGSYDKVQFEIHKLSDGDAVDTAFSYNGGKYSIVVYGKYNGADFIYRSSKSAKQKLNFNPPAVVNSVTKSNITLTVQPYTWFWNGSDYMDPRVTSNDDSIDNNIKSSFKAIKDDDHNGIQD